MILSTREVLSSKKGFVEALGITMVAMALLVAAGVLVANYAIVSKQASQLQTISQELANRAERYASTLNTDLVNPQLPTTARECSTTPAMCTTIVSDTPSAEGTQRVLRIQGDTVSLIGQTLTEDMTLVSEEVTHVTAVDAQGNKVWALSDEGLRYRVWGLADGDPTKVKPEDIAGPKAGDNRWISVTDRAGIDSTGALWVWGKNDIGQAGIDETSTAPVVPTRVTSEASFRSVVTADDRGYAIDSTGTLWAWGKNDKGQLGLGHKDVVMIPTKVTGQRMIAVTVGKDNVLAITSAGKLAMAGATQADFPAMVSLDWQTINPSNTYKAVAASATGAVALIDSAGHLTMAGNTYPFTPRDGGTFSSVSLGSTGGYAIGASGSLYSWGQGADGQLGLGAATSATTPTNILPGKLFAAVSGGETSAFAVDMSGKLYYFGKTLAGAAGAELPVVNVPTALLSESRFRVAVAHDSDAAVALLDTEGNVYGMGTTTPGLWPMSYLGANNQPIRMPVPAGFPSYTWE